MPPPWFAGILRWFAKPLSRWHSAGGQSGELADKVKRMSETYDNWFIKVRPFEISEDSRGPVKILKYRADFAGAVKEVAWRRPGGRHSTRCGWR